MIGKNISEIRKQKGLTLTELAERAGIAKSYLSNIERNLNKNPSINVVEKIASGLDIDVKTLINEQGMTQELDEEWIDLINQLKDSGVDKEEIHEYKTLIEFIKWQNKKD